MDNKIVLSVKVISGAKTEKIKWEKTLNIFKIYVNSIREKGKANTAVINLISKIFDLPYSKIKIENGTLSEYKLISIEATNILEITNKINLLKK